MSLKERFLWGMYRKRGLVFCEQKLKETSQFSRTENSEL